MSENGPYKVFYQEWKLFGEKKAIPLKQDSKGPKFWHNLQKIIAELEKKTLKIGKSLLSLCVPWDSLVSWGSPVQFEAWEQLDGRDSFSIFWHLFFLLVLLFETARHS